MKPVIHSVKHYVQHSISTTVAGAVSSVNLVKAVVPSAVNSAIEVSEGASVKAVWLEMWIRTGDTAHGSFVFIIEKVPGISSVNPTAANMGALNDYTNKKNILYTCQGLSNDQDADAVPIYKGWIKIPKSKQRFGLDDQLNFHIFAQALDQITCGFATYKEYN